jgi:hypothetical protein
VICAVPALVVIPSVPFTGLVRSSPMLSLTGAAVTLPIVSRYQALTVCVPFDRRIEKRVVGRSAAQRVQVAASLRQMWLTPLGSVAAVVTVTLLELVHAAPLLRTIEASVGASYSLAGRAVVVTPADTLPAPSIAHSRQE